MNTLVLGGAASGKSAFAEQCACDLAARLGAPLVYVATLNAVSGGDTPERIRRHRAARAGKGFATLEWCDCRRVPDLRRALAAAGEGREVLTTAGNAGVGGEVLTSADAAAMRTAALATAPAQPRPVALIEDFGNLVANYLYPPASPHENAVATACDSASAVSDRAPVLLSADDAVEALVRLLRALCAQTSACVSVTNEITLGGALPDGVRRYAEVLAKLNARWAAACERVYAVVAGIPIALK